MQEFRIFRALGLSFVSWFRNFIPFTLLAAVLYMPVIAWIATYDIESATSTEQLFNGIYVRPIYALVGASALLSPLLTYRVIQELNGTRVSILASIKHGVRGIVPALIFAVIVNVVQMIPLGGILGSILTCIWFVAAPSAVAERLGPIAAFQRSAELTSGRRWGIFGLSFLMGIAVFLLLLIWIAPMFVNPTMKLFESLKSTGIAVVIVLGVFQMFHGIVEAVSYALLRQDKDGVSHQELASVFD